MKLLRMISLIVAALGVAHFAGAQPVIDTLTVQGYMRRANATAVTNGTYNVVYGVRQNGVTIWAKTISTTISNGLFSANLQGLGDNVTGLTGGGVSLNGNFSAVTLNPALLQGAGNGSIVVRVFGVQAIDGANPAFDISIGSNPTAFVAGLAQSVAAGAVGLTGIAAAARTNTSAGVGDAGKLVQLDGAGLIASSMMPTSGISAGAITTGSLPTARLDAVSTSAGAGDSGKVVILGASGRINANMLPTTGIDASAISTGTLAVVNGGTGATSVSAARTALSAAASGANSDITSLTAVTSVQSSAGLTVSSAAAGATIVGDNTGAASTTVRAGTGGTTINSAATNATAINVAVTGTNGGITLAPNGTGVVTVAGTTPTVTSGGTLAITATGAMTIGSASTTNVIVGNTGGAANTQIRAGTGRITIGAAGTAITSMGACTTASISATAAGVATPCTGLPATASVSCSPNAGVGNFVVSARASSAGNVTINASGAATAATYSCHWVVP